MYASNESAATLQSMCTSATGKWMAGDVSTCGRDAAAE
jgi:hypothetical protein